jgi:hypothetical protein
VSPLSFLSQRRDIDIARLSYYIGSESVLSCSVANVILFDFRELICFGIEVPGICVVCNDESLCSIMIPRMVM